MVKPRWSRGKTVNPDAPVFIQLTELILFWDFSKKPSGSSTLDYTQYGPIKNSRIKNQPQILEKNKEPALRILDLKNRFSF